MDEYSHIILGYAMDLAAERGWRRTGLAEVAKRSGLPLAEVHQRFPTRVALLVGIAKQANNAALAGQPPDESESARDRVFDVMMRRFDALSPYRSGLAAVMRDLPREPLTALAFSTTYARSMAWMLRAAKVDPDRPGGIALVVGLSAVHARVMLTFLRDDTVDHARTMAALDAELRRAESWINTCCRSHRKTASDREPMGASAG